MQCLNLNQECVVPENINTPPTEGIGISWGLEGSVRQKHLKKCMKLNWNFQKGGEVVEKIPSVGEVWMLSEPTQFFKIQTVVSQQHTSCSQNVLSCCNISQT